MHYFLAQLLNAFSLSNSKHALSYKDTLEFSKRFLCPATTSIMTTLLYSFHIFSKHLSIYIDILIVNEN